MYFLFGLFVWTVIGRATIVNGQGLQNRMDIPMGVPDLDDRFSNGLANYIGVRALQGASDSTFGAQERSGAGSGPGNLVGDVFSMPQLQSNTAGMSKWFGPEFAPPRGPQMFPQGQQQDQLGGARPDDGSIQVSDLACTQLQSVIGMSNDRNHWLSTVECECRPQSQRQQEYACYSLCDAPAYGTRCEATFSILNSCPSYRNCGDWTQSNSSDSGAVSCKPGVPVPESICWILASAQLRVDDSPLRPPFYANAAGGCFMSCLCGKDGTVSGDIQCVKNPTTKWRFPIYPRSQKFDFRQNG